MIRPVAHVIALAFALCWFSVAAEAQTNCRLINPSFEAVNFAGFDGWNPVNSVVGDASLPVHGAVTLRADGPDLGSWAIAGVWQAFDAAPGQTWRASARAGHSDERPLTGGCRAIINIEWRDGADQLISYASVDVADAASPIGEMTPGELTAGPAPAGTASVRVVLAIVQPPTNDPGSALFDLAKFERIDPPEPETEWPDFPGGREIEFAGYTWRVKGPGTYGPGPSFFSDDEAVVSVSEDGLRLGIDRVNGVWSSSEVVLTEPLGYGRYEFTVAEDAGSARVGLPEDWDANVVLGLFTWEYTGCYQPWNPDNRHNEFDVEISRWGDPGNQLAQFVAQPYDYAGNIERFDTTFAGGAKTFVLYWLPDRVDCAAYDGEAVDPAALFYEWSYRGRHVPRPEQPRIHLNFWQLNGPPTSGRGHSALISGFRFTPACALDGGRARDADDLYEAQRNPSDLDRDGLVTPADSDCLEDWLRGRD